MKIAGAVSVAALAISGCGAGNQASTSGAGFPIIVDNCGHQVRIDHQPRRVVALGPSELTSLVAAGAAATLVGRDDAGAKSAPYPDDIRAAVASVPQLGTGGELTREAIIALQPDLVVGSVTETVTPDSLAAVGIPLLSLRGNCGSNHAPGIGDGTADFDDVITDIEQFGRLLGTSDRASAATAAMRQQIAQARPPAAVRGKTAVAVIVFKNGLEVYGRQSMAHTQFTTLGLTDAFADANSRVFEANIEEVLNRNPDIVMILSYGQTDDQARSAFLAIPGAANLTAVRTGSVFVQPYEYSSQGSLSVLGLTNIARNLAHAQ